MGTSKQSRYLSGATKLPPNDTASFPSRFTYVHSRAVRDRQREQFFEVPMRKILDTTPNPYCSPACIALSPGFNFQLQLNQRLSGSFDPAVGGFSTFLQ